MSLINSQILPFHANAFRDGELVEVSQDDIAGKWAIFFFYPGDFTFVCPTELADLAEHYEELQKMGVEVFSVSTDSHFVHKAWHDTSKDVSTVQYTMIGDPALTLTRNFGVERVGAGQADRATFLVDPDGIIQFYELTAEGIGRNATELVRKVKAAQHVRKNPGQVCPAHWDEGDDTLAPSIDLIGKI
ncbi:alkyl hydroperoxide reductase subunit C [Cutibacterium granulosum]|uniref:alkyl hydroperoxide reductase subunit C n=1 Tax=Cutibacterium granulosum TaxID=33011 RepID=UPI002B22291E|nr:alkyl hydroperoxide reductase subunit C [Cutibacterium granulosum]MEA5640124.1 alkyl hydroperoxide reductase subunit C [Cutibacterium granulosum]